MISQAKVATQHGELYLKKMCRHFAHKVPTTILGHQGRIDLPFGRCRIDTGEDHMLLHLEIENADDVGRAEEVITDHLLRMANKDAPSVQWNRTDNTLST